MNTSTMNRTTPTGFAGGATREEKIAGAQGLQIFVRSWRPPGGRAGWSSSSRGQIPRRPLPTGRRNSSWHGWAVYALDLRGRGSPRGSASIWKGRVSTSPRCPT